MDAGERISIVNELFQNCLSFPEEKVVYIVMLCGYSEKRKSDGVEARKGLGM